jgi:hypothetical protein
MTFARGDCGWFLSSGQSDYTVAFVGQIPQGYFSQLIPETSQVVLGSDVPQAGGISTTLMYEPTLGDILYKYVNGHWLSYTFDEFDGAWYPEEPQIAIGEAFEYYSANRNPYYWVRDWSVW